MSDCEHDVRMRREYLRTQRSGASQEGMRAKSTVLAILGFGCLNGTPWGLKGWTDCRGFQRTSCKIFAHLVGTAAFEAR
eukprot:2180162-Pleurochrysis_carterae.AAC.3